MDYTPPPDLLPYHAFLDAAKTHFRWRGISGDFGPAFSLTDLYVLSDQTEPQGEVCMRQLKAKGRCELTNLRADNKDKVEMRLDRACAVLTRTGKVSGSAVFPVPPEIGKLLPAAVQTMEPLDCSKPGVVELPKTSLQQYWHEVAGKRQALAPAIPRLPGYKPA